MPAHLRRSILRAACLVPLVLSCSENAATAIPEPLVVALHRDSVHFSRLGDSTQVTLDVSRGEAPVITPVTWATGDISVAIARTDGHVLARGGGSTWLYAWTDSGGVDSARVVVAQEVARIEIEPAAAARAIGRSAAFTARAYDASGALVPDAHFTWTSSDSSVAAVDAPGTLVARKIGATTVRAASGGVTANARMDVTGRYRLAFRSDTIRVGVGQMNDAPEIQPVPDTLDAAEQVTIAVLVADSATAGASAVVDAHSPLRVTGRSAGISRITACAPRFECASAVVHVTPPRLVVGPTPALDTVELLMGRDGSVPAYPADSLGEGHSHAGLQLRWSSSDSTVAEPNASALAGPMSITVRPRSPGSAWIVGSAPGYPSDSVFGVVRPGAVVFRESEQGPFRKHPTFTIGVGQQASLWTVASLSSWPSYTTVTLTGSNHGRVEILDGTQVPGAAYDPLRIHARAPGVDTLVASADGHVPDTLVVHVTTPRFEADAGFPEADFPDSAYSRSLPHDGMLSVHDSTGAMHWADGLTVRVTSSDTTVVRPAAGTLRFSVARQSVGYRMDFRAPGTATITFADSAGVYPALSRTVRVRASRLLLAAGCGAAEMHLGMGQLHGSLDCSPEVAVFPSVHVLPAPAIAADWTVRSTDTMVVRASRTGDLLEVVAMPRTGEAWLVVEASGVFPDSVRTFVNRPQLHVIATPGHEYGALRVELRDERGNVRPTAEPLTIRLHSTAPTVMVPESSVVTIPAGAWSTPRMRITTLKAGRASIRAEDPRDVPGRYTTGMSDVLVVP